MICRFTVFYTTLLLSSSFFSAYADEIANATTSINSLTVGAVTQVAPSYSGSNHSKLSMLPVIQAHHGEFFFDSVKGIGYDLQGPAGFYIEQTIGYDLGRADINSEWRDGDNQLKGLGTIKSTVNTSLTIGYQTTDWLAAEAMMTAPLTDSQGARYQTTFKGGLWQNTNNTISFEADLLFGSHTYMNTFYGVNSQQSQKSAFREYTAAGGMYAQSAYIDWTHKLTEHWGTDWSVGYTYLNDKAADSPIVNQRNDISTIFVITYTF
ncbi:MipA/OmpV family protein [uncultured Tolumonas sp.]|uniref:MipA/OmpV family protein n=1 Tax=uncultured Tolumonas sp. TaxID=263765 RepID=UPI002930B18E|nr:MipA/OmpV family protein [uncultured Tolumonas sp.]